ncbi:MAG: SMI1/KNR4 family protein [Thaumarchaeota archaeon]|nr:SMI1/KNR4 family protein [Nitrososphaerota archaeon]
MSPYHDEGGRQSSAVMSPTAYGGSGSAVAAASPVLPRSPSIGQPYSPGSRSQSAQRAAANDGFEMQSPAGEIPMQSFKDGLPPPPPPSHSWKRIDEWAEDNYPELYDQLCEACTSNDLNELEHFLDCSLPLDVRESLQTHDGQERGGNPTGIIFGSMLLDCEEIVQEWDQWRQVNQQYLLETTPSIASKPAVPSKSVGGSSEPSSSSSTPTSPNPGNNNNPMWRQELLQKQDCVPPNTVQKTYAHPAWIPLVRDWGGNNLAVDLAPGPAGHWGQIILFGRDYDTKYVVARSWAAFLAIVADDLNSGKWFVDEDTNELKLREFKQARVEPAYFDILRWRMDQKFGRRVNKRKSVAPGSRSPTSTGSPYVSPAEPNGEPRGRPLQRLGQTSPLASPIRPGLGKSSPLARVTEETSLSETGMPDSIEPENLVDVETPRGSSEENRAPPRLAALTNGRATSAPESAKEDSMDADAKADGKQQLAVIDEAMKTIDI